MTPGARLQAIIEITLAIETTPRPADATVAAYLRGRRYIGAKDRKAIVEGVYALQRRRGRLHWWLAHLGVPESARALAIADLLLGQGAHPDAVRALFGEGGHGPDALGKTELALIDKLAGQSLEHRQMPEAVAVECPGWAEAGLRAAMGADFAAELRAQTAPAPLDLRVNTLLADRQAVQIELRRDGIDTVLTAQAPYGLRCRGRPNIAAHRLFKAGAVEVQDEGSQLVAEAVAAAPGMQVLDLCAGAGGKTLAVGAAMANKGRVVACDVLAGKLRRAKDRFKRAGLHNIETRALAEAGQDATPGDKWLKRQKGTFDRVLVDAPCSGTGTWRRNPDQRWRPLGPQLDELTALQARLLKKGARAVKPGGRLIYATCSLLPAENEAVVETFLAEHPDYRPVSPLPEIPDRFLRLSPAQHGTDGFFCAVLERKCGA